MRGPRAGGVIFVITDKSESFMQLKARFQAEFKPRYSTRTAPVGAAGGGAAVAPRGTARTRRGQESATDDPGARGRASCCGVLLLSGGAAAAGGRRCGATCGGRAARARGAGRAAGCPPKAAQRSWPTKPPGKKRRPKEPPKRALRNSRQETPLAVRISSETRNMRLGQSARVCGRGAGRARGSGRRLRSAASDK